MAVRVGVVNFPGTNCEHDALLAVERLGATADLLWHGATSVDGYDALILPGGSPTATTCARVPSPASPRSWRRSAGSQPMEARS